MALAVITDTLNNKVQKIFPIDYPTIEITPITQNVVLKDILQFRVRFSAIQIQGLGTNPPAIPLQVIGYSNYIL